MSSIGLHRQVFDVVFGWVDVRFLRNFSKLCDWNVRDVLHAVPGIEVATSDAFLDEERGNISSPALLDPSEIIDLRKESEACRIFPHWIPNKLMNILLIS